MLTIAKLFGKSPFAPLQTHMEKVSECVHLLDDLFDALKDKHYEKISEIQKKISKKEHDADLTKNDIRNHLPKSLFMPIDRFSFLDILHLQDAFADKAEDIAIIVSLKEIDYNELEGLDEFIKKTLETFDLAFLVIKEFDNLIESSFGGIEARKVKEMTEHLAYMEHEIDIMSHKLLKNLYSITDKMPYSSFHLWNLILKEIGEISNIAENLGNRIRMILELK
ncbi:MAG: TIGR00153 family protein [Parachlamydiales bacterium]|nr:TIGR00153 family protein [Parachlamydiales bacterium]